MIAEFLADHPDVVSICYHTPWPGALDELYLHNREHNQARTDLYEIPYVPYAWFDGKIYAYDPTSRYWYDWAYDWVADDPTAVTLDLSGTHDPDTGTIRLTVTATLGAELPAGDYRLHAVLVENGVVWAAPNGQDVHDHVMRRMLPDAGGSPIALDAAWPQTHAVTLDLTLDPLYVPEHCEFVCFLQDHAELDVHQAASVAVADLTVPTAAPDVASAVRLGACYPNPFNPRTTVPLRLDRDATVALTVHAADGRLVRRLHAGSLPAGEHRFEWDGRNEHGAGVASGVYLVRMRGGDGASTSRRVVLMK